MSPENKEPQTEILLLSHAFVCAHGGIPRQAKSSKKAASCPVERSRKLRNQFLAFPIAGRPVAVGVACTAELAVATCQGTPLGPGYYSPNFDVMEATPEDFLRAVCNARWQRTQD